MLATSLLPSHGTGLSWNLLLVRAAQFTSLLLRVVKMVLMSPVVAIRMVKAGNSTSSPIQSFFGEKPFATDSQFLLHSTTCQKILILKVDLVKADDKHLVKVDLDKN